MTTSGTTVQEDRTMRSIQDMASFLEQIMEGIDRIGNQLERIADKMEAKK